MGNFKKLSVWEKSHELVMEIYQITEGLPITEKFALLDQMRRCAVSIPANIAEGSANTHSKNFCRYLDIAYSSSNELDYYLILSKDLKYIEEPKYNELSESSTTFKE